MIEIPLTRGHVTVIDDEDAAFAFQSWHAHRGGRRGQHLYAKSRKGFLHRLLLGLTDPALVVDHINGNGLDNRRVNLRVVTKRQNLANSRIRPTKKSSQFRGVYRVRGKWIARVEAMFDTEEEAARAYDRLAGFWHGPCARRNFDDSGD